LKKLIFFIQTILNRKNRFAPELLEGLNSVSHSHVRWSRRLMKISDRMKFDIPTQKAIYLVGMDYIKKKHQLRAEIPHLPDILEKDMKIMRIQRDLEFQKILTVRFQDFKSFYYKYGKY
jgi:hypothetical protein